MTAPHDYPTDYVLHLKETDMLTDTTPYYDFASGGSVSVSSPERGKYPDPIGPDAYHGIAGQIVRELEPHSEADPAVLLVRLLSAVGCMIGRKPGIDIDGIHHGACLWPVVVGGTAEGRKGQSWGSVRRALKLTNSAFCTENIAGGLTTGQGLVHAVRDPLRGIPSKPNRAQRDEMDSNEDGLCVLDGGVSDKRLIVREPELAKVLAAAAREGNNLSATLRDAWDGNPLREMTRTNPYGSTEHHIIVQADVTPSELQAMLSATEKANGFANRFIFVASQRSKSLPFGGELRDSDIQHLTIRLRSIIQTASNIGPMTWSKAARPIWADLYEQTFSGNNDSALSMLLARGATHLLRLSITYALLDESDQIEPKHIAAAVAVWDYAKASTAWAFGEAVAEENPDGKLLQWIEGQGGVVTARDVYRKLNHKYTKTKAEAALQRLADSGAGTYGSDPSRPGSPTKHFSIANPTDTDTTPRNGAVSGGGVSKNLNGNLR